MRTVLKLRLSVFGSTAALQILEQDRSFFVKPVNRDFCHPPTGRYAVRIDNSEHGLADTAIYLWCQSQNTELRKVSTYVHGDSREAAVQVFGLFEALRSLTELDPDYCSYHLDGDLFTLTSNKPVVI